MFLIVGFGFEHFTDSSRDLTHRIFTRERRAGQLRESVRVPGISLSKSTFGLRIRSFTINHWVDAAEGICDRSKS